MFRQINESWYWRLIIVLHSVLHVRTFTLLLPPMETTMLLNDKSTRGQSGNAKRLIGSMCLVIFGIHAIEIAAQKLIMKKIPQCYLSLLLLLLLLFRISFFCMQRQIVCDIQSNTQSNQWIKNGDGNFWFIRPPTNLNQLLLVKNLSFRTTYSWNDEQCQIDKICNISLSYAATVEHTT